MPWGKGSINRNMAADLRCRDRQTGLAAGASHTEIFFNLGMDRVHYVPQQEILHFVDSEHFNVLDTIRQVYEGLGRRPDIRQMYLDEHGYYKGAQRLKLPSDDAHAVLAALRLTGVKISIASN